MSEEFSISSLPPEIRAALRQARVANELTHERKAAMAERLQNAVLSPHAVSDVPFPAKGGEGAMVPSSASGFSGWILAGVGLLGVAVGWVGGVWSSENAASTELRKPERPAPEAAPIEEVALPIVADPAGETVAHVEIPSPEVTQGPKAASPEGAVPASEPNEAELSFYEELSYLRRAQSALREGNSALSLGLMLSLDDLNQGGALLSERRMTKLLALCALGRTEEAFRIGEKILQGDSKGVYRLRIQSSCVGEGSGERE